MAAAGPAAVPPVAPAAPAAPAAATGKWAAFTTWFAKNWGELTTGTKTFFGTPSLLSFTVAILAIGALIGVLVGIGYGIEKSGGSSTIFILIIVGVIILVAFLTASKSFYGEGIKEAITVPFTILIYFLPYFVGFFAIFNDFVVGTLSLSLGVIMAFILNIINLFLGTYLTPAGTTPAKLNDLCGLPGLSYFNSGLLPQAPLFVSTVMAYIATFTSVVQGGGSDAAKAAWAMWGAFGLAQYVILWKNSDRCLETIPASWVAFGKPKLAPFVSIAIGLLVGGLFGLYAYDPKFGGLRAAAAPGLGSTAPNPLAGSGSSTTPSVGTCSAPNDQDQFVCETYKDGKLVTSTIASS